MEGCEGGVGVVEDSEGLWNTGTGSAGEGNEDVSVLIRTAFRTVESRLSRKLMIRTQAFSLQPAADDHTSTGIWQRQRRARTWRLGFLLLRW